MVDAMDIKNGYKKSDVGLIPEDWEVKTLSEVGESIIGLTYSPANVKPYGKLVLRSSNVQDGKLAFDDNVFVEMDFPPRVIVKENDILICVRNGSRRLIGKCALIDKKTAGSAFGAFMSVYRSEFSTFLFHQFQSFIIQWQINETLGATINQITNKDLASFRVPIPPTKDEQNTITTALNDADLLNNAIEKLITKKRAIKQGAMQDLLKPKEGWNIEPLGKYVKISSGESPSKFEFVDYGTPYFKVEQLNNSEKYIFESIYHIRATTKIAKGSIIFPKRGASIFMNKIRILKEDSYMDTNLMTLTIINGELNNEYLFYQLSYIGLDIIADTTSIPQINNKHINPFLLPFPKSIDDQKNIVQILSDIDLEIKQLEQKLAKQKMMKQGMMQALLTGKVRLL